MYTLATPEGVHANRCRVFLKNELQLQDRGIDYREETNDDGFVTFIFIDIDEDEFRNIVEKLKAQGVSMIGVDSQLTERKIMKLANLLKENYSYPTSYSENNGWVPIEKLEDMIQEWSNKNQSGAYRDNQDRADQYFMDLEGLVSFWKDYHHDTQDSDKVPATNPSQTLAEQKIRQIIRKVIRK